MSISLGPISLCCFNTKLLNEKINCRWVAKTTNDVLVGKDSPKGSRILSAKGAFPFNPNHVFGEARVVRAGFDGRAFQRLFEQRTARCFELTCKHLRGGHDSVTYLARAFVIDENLVPYTQLIQAP